jgi:selenoprotein W-related protein
LIPGKGGVFEVTVDGKKVFSKKELGRFPEDGEVVQRIRSA